MSPLRNFAPLFCARWVQSETVIATSGGFFISRKGDSPFARLVSRGSSPIAATTVDLVQIRVAEADSGGIISDTGYVEAQWPIIPAERALGRDVTREEACGRVGRKRHVIASNLSAPPAMMLPMSPKVVDLQDRPVYGFGQVDRILGLKSGTSQRWIDGYNRGARPIRRSSAQSQLASRRSPGASSSRPDCSRSTATRVCRW